MGSHFLIRKADTPDYPGIKGLLCESAHLYPGIHQWWDKHVKYDLPSGRRVVTVLENHGQVEGVFIGKKGEHAKLCTLRLRPSTQGHGLGRTLALAGLQRLLDSHTQDVHVTVSQGADQNCAPFFEALGFVRRAIARGRYIKGVDEFVYHCPAPAIRHLLHDHLSALAESTLYGLRPLPRSSANTIVMSLKPHFAELFLSGRKTVEFRRQFSGQHAGSRAVFYVSSPVRSFVFSAVATKVDHATTSQLWSEYRAPGGVRKETFDEYFRGTQHGYAIVFERVEPFAEPLPLDSARAQLPDLRPPQSFMRVDSASPLLRMLRIERQGHERRNLMQEAASQAY